MKKNYKYNDLIKKAQSVIPGGGSLFSKRPELFLPEQWPSFFSKAYEINVEDLNIIEENIKLREIHTIKENIYREAKDKNVNFGKLMQFLRISLVGNLSGADIFFIIEIIGKNVTLQRFNSLLNKTKK